MYHVRPETQMAQPFMVRGIAVPPLFYGTAWKEERTEALTLAALRAGFRAIDTANQRRHYVEAAVGDAVRAFLGEGKVTRAELFLQTKFTHARGQDHRLPYDPSAAPAAQVAQSFQSSLEHLHTDYLDSYVLHGPSHAEHLSSADWEVWRAMSALQRAGRTRLLGISNVSLPQLISLCDGDEVRPAFVQNRCYARTGWDREIRTFCRTHGIVYQGFSLLTANRRELQSAPVRRIMERTGATAAQIVFRFALQVGMIPLTGTSDANHMREDLDCGAFTLGEEELDALMRIGLL
jgi:diketogulonate reductase-like aldo/keto reductase